MNSTLAETIKKADELYALRSRAENVRASVALLRAASAPLDYEICWRLGRALFFLGQEARARTEARAFHKEAAGICKRAAELEPSRVEGHFWLGVNLALLAQHENPFKALLRAFSARRTLRRAVELDPAYHAAGPLRVLARLEHRLPTFLGGSRKRACALFQRAISLDQRNTVTRLYFAELLLETGDTAGARRELEALLRTPPDPAWAFEDARDRQLAEKMLRRIRDGQDRSK
ncbi:MAG TPA: TRAP transporter TatT component family protein [Pyrinomonadaceae bacterium]|jgi:tetratricopeptide (TPR) repeat protein